MKKDPTEFRQRFAAWKNGEQVYEAGLPKYKDGYESFLATLPDNQRKPGAYNTRRYWELNGKPKNFAEAIGKGMYNIQEDDGVLGWHANSVSYNENNDTYEFMKPNYHPTRWMELVYGYDQSPEFLKEWKVLYNGPMLSDRYIRREKPGLKTKGGQLPKFAIGTEGDDIEELIRKRLEQRSDNTSVQRQEPVLQIKRNFIAEAQRKHAAEAVGPDTRSSYQRKQSLAAKLYANQQYQKAKDDAKRAEGFENLMKLSRPSTYVEAATGLDLGVAGRLATDVVAFGLPGLLKHGAAKVATSPAMQYVRYPIGKIRFGFDAQLPTLYRKVKTLPTIENGIIKISTPQNRFAFENGYGEESPLITNFTTDAPVRSHSAGNWDRGVTLAIPGKKLLGKNVISTRPSDTFTYGNDIQVNIGDVTAITGRQKEIDFLTNHGINTISSDKLKSKFAEDAVKYMQDIAKVRATYPRVFGQKGIVLLKPKTPIEDFSNYAAEVENVSRDFFTSPTLKDYKFMDYVFRPKYTSETMPMYNVSSLESLNQAPQLGEWLGEDTKRMYLLDTNRWKNVMYDPSTPVESLFRQGLNIGLKPEYRK